MIGGLLLILGLAAAPAADGAERVSVARTDGLRAIVNWPAGVSGRSLAPGSAVQVRVHQRRDGRPRTFTVSLARADGRKLVVIERRTLRAGIVRLAVPTSAARSRLVLQLRSRGKVLKRLSFSTRLKTTNPTVPAPTPTAPAPEPPQSQPFECRTDTAVSAQVTIETPTVQPGGTVRYDVVNDGQACNTLLIPTLERQTESATWAPVPIEFNPPTSYDVALPGARYTGSLPLPVDAPFGTYRLLGQVRRAYADPSTPGNQITTEATFTVTP